jgi:hypothetical protein
MIRNSFVLVVLSLCIASGLAAQTPAAAPAAAVWSALLAGAVDPAKSAHVENLAITRDLVHITLVDGVIEFTQPANGVVFGAVFHGSGRLQVDSPNSVESQQLYLFTKQPKLDLPFSDATFSFTDTLLDEVAKQVKWQDNGPASDDLYAKRQAEREELGAGYLPRLFKSILSPDHQRTAYFLADFRTKEKGWVEVRDDATQLEEIRVGHWGESGPVRILDFWMNFPAGGRDPHHAYDDPSARQDFLIPRYQISASVGDNADVNVTARTTLHSRYSGERVVLFSLDSNLRLSSIKDAQGRDLEFFQSKERKDRYQSYGDYVAVVLKTPTETGRDEVLEFQYGGKRVVFKVGNGNYFCKSFGWYPSMFDNELGVALFAFRSDFELTFRNPKKYALVATGDKISDTTDERNRSPRGKAEYRWPRPVSFTAITRLPPTRSATSKFRFMPIASPTTCCNLSSVTLTIRRATCKQVSVAGTSTASPWRLSESSPPPP